VTGAVAERSAIGRALWLALPVAVLLAAASSPAIAQRVPRFLFPALAALGGALLGRSLMRALVRLARAPAPARRVQIVPVVLIGVAALFFLILPLARLVYVLLPSTGREPKILAGFGDWRGSEGYPRLDAHRGIDVAGRPGVDVLAAAGGRVTVARDSHDLCGLIVVVDHEPHGIERSTVTSRRFRSRRARPSCAASRWAPWAPAGSAPGQGTSTCTWSCSEATIRATCTIRSPGWRAVSRRRAHILRTTWC
jgi:hypothetical protein